MNHQSANADSKPLISLVVPCYNEAEVFPLLRKELVDLAETQKPGYRFEFIFIDDGSRDATWEQIMAFSAEDSRVRAIALSRNFGHQLALTCGYDLAQGDAVISLDADLQDPPETIPEMIAQWEKGADIVYAVRTHRAGESRFKLWTAKWFYRLFHKMGKSDAPMDAGDFRLMSKRSVEAFRQLRERHRYIRGLVGWLGFRSATVAYERRSRPAGTTKYPLMRMAAFAMDGIVSLSSFPLRLSYLFAMFGSILVFGYLGWVVIKYLLWGELLVRGWTSTILVVTLFGSLTLFCLGIIGEYIGRIYEQSKNRPLYLIRDVIEKPEKGTSDQAD